MERRLQGVKERVCCRWRWVEVEKNRWWPLQRWLFFFFPVQRLKPLFSLYLSVLIDLPHVTVYVSSPLSLCLLFLVCFSLLSLLYSPLFSLASPFFFFSSVSLFYPFCSPSFPSFFFSFLFLCSGCSFFFCSISFILSLFFFSFSPLYLNQFFLQSLILPARFYSLFSPSVRPFSLLLSLYFCPLFSSLPLSIYRQKERDSPCPVQSWDRVGWLRRPLCNRLEPLSEHGSLVQSSYWLHVMAIGCISLLASRRVRVALQGRETSSSPASAYIGEEEDPQCHSKRHRIGFCLLLFLWIVHEMLFWPKRAISFKRKWRQNVNFSNQSNLRAFSILVIGFGFL